MWMLCFGLLRIVLLSMVIAKLTKKGVSISCCRIDAAVDGEWQPGSFCDFERQTETLQDYARPPF